ncbi:MAG: SurA N-terminal domain-containing protein [Aromatoleum sp.]|jgi:peptidyl-prolyl cis-trans isomerase D|uniref:SurA N-terminal domain-containing protein n=1 Tax=Aromatoleum sp. TaxID=2307007 RepID=UPI002895F2C6|nr:SurA N-terminal domain-containing protein [Aromatoleum sp.]MDT3669188.1 SurA N-terminal domain-containing protein [Aromatoleum sp.]
MFEAVRNNKRIAQFILALLIIPFAFFGMDAYFTDGPSGNEIATVGGSKISVVEFDQALRDQQARVREAMGGDVDRSLLDSDAMRRSVLENLVNQRLLALFAADKHMTVMPQQLQQVIAEVPAFQTDGRFALDRYEAALRAQGMSPASFEARLAQDLRIQQIALAVGESGFAAHTSAQRFLAAQLEERKIREMAFTPARFLADVKLGEDAAKQYYEANPARFERPARIQAEYVVFDEDAVSKQITVSDDEIRKYYEANAARFSQPEERNARHILITVADGASEDEVAKARAKAEGILAQLRENPARFAELAKAESQDPGSAAQGGELGFFGRGAMVKAFEDAAFALEKGQISDVVRSDFGFHIIQITDIKPATARPIEQVKDEIAEELKRQSASRRFAELAEHFSNLVYEQPDSLKPAAEELQLEIHRTDWISRADGRIGEFDNEKLLNALFSPESIDKRRNVEATEVGRGKLVSARVADYQPAQRLPFEQVKGDIEQQLRTEEAAKLAAARGKEALTTLAKGEDVPGEWSEVRTLQRGTASLAPAAIDAIFGAAANKLPAHVGVAMPDGHYSVFRIESVNRPELAKDDPRMAAVMQQYQRLIGERDFSAFLASLRERYKVEINEAAVKGQTQTQ